MDETKKLAVSTGHLPSIRTGKGSKGSRPKPTPPKISVSRVQPQSNNVPILEGSLPTGKSRESGFLATKIAIQDFAEVMKCWPKSWIASAKGKIYMCIEDPTGKFAMVDGKPYFDSVSIDMLLEKAAAATTGKKNE